MESRYVRLWNDYDSYVSHVYHFTENNLMLGLLQSINMTSIIFPLHLIVRMNMVAMLKIAMDVLESGNVVSVTNAREREMKILNIVGHLDTGGDYSGHYIKSNTIYLGIKPMLRTVQTLHYMTMNCTKSPCTLVGC